MAAVQVRNGYKYYGSSTDPKIVLNYININVEQGSIYGLLGASGCGKTTLLSCIVGQKQLISGDIRVLGVKPGLPGSGVPGPLVGYMPQELALVEEMTVKETIYYFGRIYDLSDEKIHQRYNLLKNLLELPPANRLVGQCSGGQKRRVSFACALVHEPELLILDEPTVGLDPMLREKIWEFLVETTRNSKTAVIITTHYIEEASKANRIGLMRNGILLAEDTPINIMHNLECNSLEEAFLKLSQRQGSENVIQRVTEGGSSVITNTNVGELNQIQTESEHVSKIEKISFTTTNRMKALLTKNIIQLTRQRFFLLFMFLLPIASLTAYFWGIGITPKYLRVGIVSDEVTNYDKCFDPSLTTIINYNNDTCEFNNISCRYINELDSDYIEKVFYNSSEEAYKNAKKIKILGYIHFPHNFSKSMQTLLEEGRFAPDNIFEGVEVTVRLDMTDQQAAYFVQRRLRETYQKFIDDLMISCNLSHNLGRPPVNFQVLYGSFSDEYQKFVTPGIFITILFFLSAMMTSGIFISERIDGIWDRTLIAGISQYEILTAHMVTQSTIMVIQCLESIVYSHYVFGVENQGDNLLIISLLILNGFCGMLFGLLISIYCSSHMVSLFIGTAVFYPLIIISGFLWPIEAVHKILKHAVLFTPFTIPAISARNILAKNWPLINPQVYNGFLVIICWILVFVVFIFIGLRRKI